MHTNTRTYNTAVLALCPPGMTDCGNLWRSCLVVIKMSPMSDINFISHLQGGEKKDSFSNNVTHLLERGKMQGLIKHISYFVFKLSKVRTHFFFAASTWIHMSSLQFSEIYSVLHVCEAFLQGQALTYLLLFPSSASFSVLSHL